MRIEVLRMICISLLVMGLAHHDSAAQWEWRNPLPQGNSLTDLQAFSATACYAAGERGIFLKTTTAGNDWDLVSVQDLPDLTYLQFFNETTGISLARRDSVSMLLKTTDGGNHWTQLQPSAGSVGAAYFLNADTGWAATRSALTFTRNGGTDWSSLALPGKSVSRLFFLDVNTGWALSADTVYRTTDGGYSWRETKVDSLFGWVVSLNKIVFVNPQVGWTIGTSRGPNHFDGHVFKSTDGGAHWTEQFSVGEDLLVYRTFSDLDMRNELLGWAVSSGSVYRTEDGGQNWKEVSRVQDLSQLSPASNAELWGCGLYGVLYRSSDSGSTWIPLHRGTIASLNDLYWLDQTTGFVVGDTLLMKTRDGGSTWETISPQLPHQGYLNIRTVWFVDSLRGWIGVERSGGWGSLLLTTDGGRSWKTQMDSVIRIVRLFFVGQNYGWASSGNRVDRTTDGGTTWEAGGISVNPGDFEALFFTSPDSGWGGGYLGLAQTTDGGMSWTTVVPAGVAGVFVQGIYFVSPSVGWAVGYSGNDGYIFKTEDGGKSWQSQTHPSASWSSYTWPLGVTFVDQNHGWVVGQSQVGGFAFATTDGGQTWWEDNVPFNRPMLCTRSDGKNVWILGDEAALLRRIVAGLSGIDQSAVEQVGGTFRLEQNYPNPFNPFTIIKYTVGGAGSRGSGPSDRDSRPASGGPEPGAREAGTGGWGLGTWKTRLVVYDLLGRQVATLVDEEKTPGSYEVRFDGNGLASGVYIYRLITGSFVYARSMMLIK